MSDYQCQSLTIHIDWAAKNLANWTVNRFAATLNCVLTGAAGLARPKQCLKPNQGWRDSQSGERLFCSRGLLYVSDLPCL